MAKRNLNGRKSGGASSIATIDEALDTDLVVEESSHAVQEETTAPKKERKAKAEPQGDGAFGVGDVRKAAAFVNSIGGLDKAIGLLQILKVAKEVQ